MIRAATTHLALLLTLLATPLAAVEVGEQLPGFKLLDLEGKVHTHETHLGHVLILYFFGHD